MKTKNGIENGNTEDKAFYRSITLDRAALDEEKRELTVSFSSETEEVIRFFGEEIAVEILSHEPNAVDLSRLKKVGSHLFNHNPDRIIGPLKNPQNIDGIGRAILGYDETEEGQLRLTQSKSGSLKGVSVRYDPIKMKRLEPGEIYKLATKEVKGRKDIPVYIVTRWQPIEISSTPVPADASVGPGRGRSLEGIEIEKSKFNNKEETEMEEKEVQTMIDKAFEKVPEQLRALVPDIVTEIRSTLTEEAKPKMAVSVEQLQELIGRGKAISQEAEIIVSRMAVVEGKNEQEITRYLLDEATKDPDAGDKGDLKGGTGLKKGEGNEHARIESFEQVEDDDFFKGLTNGNDLPLQ